MANLFFVQPCFSGLKAHGPAINAYIWNVTMKINIQSHKLVAKGQ